MTLAEWYLAESGGDVVTYHQGLSKGHRIGQAFFNALSRVDQERVRTKRADPFNKDTAIAVHDAIDFLTRKV